MGEKIEVDEKQDAGEGALGTREQQEREQDGSSHVTDDREPGSALVQASLGPASTHHSAESTARLWEKSSTASSFSPRPSPMGAEMQSQTQVRSLV